MASKILAQVGPGPWDGEEDFYKFTEPSYGLRCYVIRMSSGGQLNGYVELPRGSKYAKQIRKRGTNFYGKNRSRVTLIRMPEYDRLNRKVNVHGGLTFSGHLKKRITRKFVVGFDCAHYGDWCPLYDWADGQYHDAEAVKSYTASLARQIAKLHGLPCRD